MPVAPGIERAVYRLRTAAGPLVVHVVAADPRTPGVRVAPALAHERIRNAPGETTTAMARRHGAVAAINGDYFDIDRSGAPVGVLVQNGTLLREPRGFPAFAGFADGTFGFVVPTYTGSITTPTGRTTLAVDPVPPDAGASLLDARYGETPDGAPAFGLTALGGATYRVEAAPGPNAPRLIWGSRAVAEAGPLVPGTTVALDERTDPPLNALRFALGGGPLLVRDGADVDDPSGPNYALRATRIPTSAVALTGDGTLLFVAIDGRRPSTSIGVTRAETIALLHALGARDAMALDSGGSTTLAARIPGDAQVSLINAPSDQRERPVSDALLLLSDLPAGPPSRLVVRPAAAVALAGARVPFVTRLADAAWHGLGDATGAVQIDGAGARAEGDALVAGMRPGTYRLTFARGGLHAPFTLTVVDRVASLRLLAGTPPRVEAFDEAGEPVAVDGAARFERSGETLTVRAGGASASLGTARRAVALALFDDANRARWTFSTAPANGPGGLDIAGNALTLSYDFTAGGRAAYATADLPLGDAHDLTCTVQSDGHGAALRATLVDRNGDRDVATFSRALDIAGPQRLTLRGSGIALVPPLVLHNLYVVGTLAQPPLAVAGQITVRDCSALTGAGDAAR